MTVARVAMAAALLVAIGAAPAHADELRYAVVIGNNAGGPNDASLMYAERDAQKMYDLLGSTMGVPADNIVLLRGQDADTVQRSLIRMNDRIRTETGHQDQSTLFVYNSGHADARGLHLGRGTLALQVLEQLVRGSPATLRMLILDACASGAITRVKGARRAPAFPIDLGATRPAEGVIFLTASSEHEDAYESDRIRGSFFTHYLASSVLGAGDVDGDGAVTLAEAYQYTYDNTLRASSATAAGVQHATFRFELKGREDFVLSRPGAAQNQATLRFPPGRMYYVFREGDDDSLVAEIVAGGAERRIYVPPGRYHVRARASDYLLEGSLRVSRGDVVDVTTGLERVEYARLARKGTGPVRRTQGVVAGYRLRTALSPGESPCHGGMAAFAIDLRRVSLALFAGACESGFTNAHITATTWELDTGVQVRRVFDLPGVSIGAGVGAGPSLFHQRFETRGRAPPRWSAAGSVSAGLDVSRDLPGGLYIAAVADLQLYLIDRGELVVADVAGRFGIVVGKRWSVLR